MTQKKHMTQKKRQQPLDRHLSSFMIRLRGVYREQLQKLKLKNRRPMTAELELALEEYLAKLGLWPPGPPEEGPK